MHFNIANVNYISNDGGSPSVYGTTQFMQNNVAIYGTIETQNRPSLIAKVNDGSDATPSWLKINAQLKRTI